MLKKFTVNGFKNFADSCMIDFSRIRDYDFNRQLIRDGLVNKALLYGKNGSGKSNLGFALMDITSHLTDNAYDPRNYLFALNGDSSKSYISFSYELQYGESVIEYKYRKNEKMVLLEEEIIQDEVLVFSYDYSSNRMTSKLPEISNLNKQALTNRNMNNSVLKTLYGFSAHLAESSPIRRIYEFASGLLWFRSLGNYEFMGSTNIIENVEQYLASNNNRVKEFANS